MRLFLDFDPKKCAACGACAVACMDQNDIDLQEQEPFRQVYCVESRPNGTAFFQNFSISCMHCADAPCVLACPTGCIYKDPETGLTRYDNAKCIGCHSCAMACPFGAPSFDSRGKMVKCDGCAVRLEHGMLPACVKGCPFGAISILTEEEYRAKKREESLKRLSEEIL